MLRLRTFGSVDLRGPSGEVRLGGAGQSKRLALLVFLAVDGETGWHRRDTLVALFWPDLDQAHARAALRKGLHHLRLALGPDVVLTRMDEEVRLAFSGLWCDAREFKRLAAAGSYGEALRLYTGEFLQGLHTSGSAGFERWLDRERYHLAATATACAMELVAASRAAGKLAEATGWARLAAEIAPLEEVANRTLIELLAESGDCPAALGAYQRFADRLALELDLKPSAEIRRITDRLRREAAASSGVGFEGDPAIPRPDPLPSISDTVEVPAEPLTAASEGVVRGLIHRRKLLVGATVAATLTAGWWGITRISDPLPRIESLVVLPFANLSGDSSQQYFVDGLHAELIAELGRIASLRVISWTSAMHYRGIAKSVPQIARELDVDVVVTATVLRTGDNLRIQVQLISPEPERYLWIGTYDGTIRDPWALLARSTEAIATRIETELTGSERARLSSPRRLDPKVMELLIRGEHQLRLNQGGRGARPFFEAALRRDPAAALAYAGLANTYNTVAYYVVTTSPHEVHPRAREAALNALRLDPELAEGHIQLAWVLAVYDWNWSEAEHAFRKALQLNPGSVRGHFWYSYFWHFHRRDAEAIAEAKRALELDPLALSLRISVANLFYRIRRCDLAREQVAAAIRLTDELGVDGASNMDPNWTEGLCQLGEGRQVEGLRLMESVVRAATPSLQPRLKAELAYAYGASGRRREATALLHELLTLRQRWYFSPYLVAQVYAGLEEPDSAFSWLDRAYEGRDSWLAFLKVDPRWDGIRSDSRFQELLRRIRLAPSE